MALPITPTPILKGEDSRRFNEELAKSPFKKISKKEMEEGIELMKAVLKNAKF
jgi:hypothetical protein